MCVDVWGKTPRLPAASPLAAASASCFLAWKCLLFYIFPTQGLRVNEQDRVGVDTPGRLLLPSGYFGGPFGLCSCTERRGSLCGFHLI